jgi:hypothetical protein
MYHLELRQFPHVVRRFNLSEREVLVVAVPWVREEWVEFGGRKWNANLAKLTLLDGPQLSLPELAMGRGWRNAERKSEDVTERVLAELKARDDGATQASAEGERAPLATVAPASEGAAEEAHEHAGVREGSGDLDLLADSIGLEILALVDQAPVPLQRVWRLAHARPPERAAGESLALAERAVRSLLGRRLIVLQAADTDAGDGEAGDEPIGEALAGERVELALRAPESWGPDEPASGQSGAILVRRA